MKCLITQYGKLVFLDKIISIEIIDSKDYYTGDMEHFAKEYESILIATDVNDNEIFLGEYKDYFSCEDVRDNIALWASTDNELDYYVVMIDDPTLYPLCHEIKKKQ